MGLAVGLPKSSLSCRRDHVQVEHLPMHTGGRPAVGHVRYMHHLATPASPLQLQRSRLTKWAGGGMYSCMLVAFRAERMILL